MFKGPKGVEGVYAIVNLNDGTRYIGSSQCIEKRSRAHKNLLKNRTHFNKLLQAAWDRDGCEAFEVILLEIVYGGEDVRNKAEQRHFEATDKCYNRRVLVESNTQMDRPDIRNWAPDKFRKFDVARVLEIRAMREAGTTYRAIAKLYNCSAATIVYVVKGKGVCYSGEKSSLKHSKLEYASL